MTADVPTVTPPADLLGGPIVSSEPSVIGDRLRTPAAWCEMTPCISRYSDPSALGEADIRERAVAAGWRVDALGRLACPRCLQEDPRFRATRALVRWDREFAFAMTGQLVDRLRAERDGGGGPPVP